MAIFQTNHNQEWHNGVLVSDVTVQIDVTVPTNQASLLSKARTAVAANSTFLGLASPTNAQTVAQVQTLTKENTAIIKLLVSLLELSTDLLQDTTGT